MATKLKVMELIRLLPDADQQQVLHLRYVEGMYIHEIGLKMHFSDTKIRNLKDKGLKCANEIFEKNALNIDE